MAVSVIVAMLVIRTWFLQGLVIPVRVVSGSMADALLGPNLQIVCDDCGITFHCGIDHLPAGNVAVCPNCGYDRNDLDNGRIARGDRVLIDRTAFARRQPERWEVVAFREPGNLQQLAVKRIIGLPGERVSISDGDIHINGKIKRKTLAELRGMAVLVHDNHFRPTRDPRLPGRWQGPGGDSRWRTGDDRFVFEPQSPAAAGQSSDRTPGRLAYCHWGCTRDSPSGSQPSEVTDHYGYNQGLSPRRHYVTDLMLECRLKMSGHGPLVLLANCGKETFEISLRPREKTVRVAGRGGPIQKLNTTLPLERRHMRIELALCDRQLLLALDGQEILTHPYEPSPGRFKPVHTPLTIAAEDLTVEVCNLHVYRDVYYLNPYGANDAWSISDRLGMDEYFLLGDNAPVSVDSRHWSTCGLPRTLLVGKAIRYTWGQTLFFGFETAGESERSE